MTDRDALLAGLRAAPADDLPRLVFADWLDEHGDPDRAEFIRVQVELAAGPDPARRPALAARERELLTRHRRLWRVPRLTGPQHFSRGFVEGVETTADSLLGVPPAAFDGAVVRAVRLVNADRRVDELPGLSVWETVENLALNNNSFGTEDRLSRLFAAAAFPRLTGLSLRNNQLWPDGVAELAGLAVAPRLTRLDVSGNPVTDLGAATLGGSEAFAGLEQLYLRSDELHVTDCVHAAGVNHLATSPTLARLRTLNLADQYAGDAGVVSLARSPNAARLTDLDLAYNDIGLLGPAAVVELTASPYLARLRRLDLAGNRLDRAAVAALLAWPRLAALDRLDLRDCDLDDAGRALLSAAPAGPVLWDAG